MPPTRAREHGHCRNAQQEGKHPALVTSVGRIVCVEDMPLQDGGLMLFHGALRHVEVHISKPAGGLFCLVPRDLKKIKIQFYWDSVP